MREELTEIVNLDGEMPCELLDLLLTGRLAVDGESALVAVTSDPGLYHWVSLELPPICSQFDLNQGILAAILDEFSNILRATKVL